VTTWLFYTFTQHVGALNWHFMSTNTSLKLKLLLILKQSQTWSNARDLRQHKCRPMRKLTKRINMAIPCGPYLPHGAFCGIFHLVLGGWKVEPFFHVSPTYLLLKSIGENTITMILWFLNIRHSGTLFGMWFPTSAQQMFHLILLSKG
jgi:hypothetical protein